MNAVEKVIFKISGKTSSLLLFLNKEKPRTRDRTSLSTRANYGRGKSNTLLEWIVNAAYKRVRRVKLKASLKALKLEDKTVRQQRETTTSASHS